MGNFALRPKCVRFWAATNVQQYRANALLCFRENYFSIYFIVDSTICRTTTQRKRIVTFPCQQCLHERAIMLCFTYTVIVKHEVIFLYCLEGIQVSWFKYLQLTSSCDECSSVSCLNKESNLKQFKMLSPLARLSLHTKCSDCSTGCEDALTMELLAVDTPRIC